MSEISKILQISYGQVKYTIQSGRTSPRKSTGRPPKLLTEQVDELEAYVRRSSNTRQMSYLELAMKFPQWNVVEEAVKNSLQQEATVAMLLETSHLFLLKTRD